MSGPRVVITRPVPGDPVGRLAAAGVTDVRINEAEEALSRAALLEMVEGAAAVLATPADTRCDAELFDAAGPGLRVVSNYAVGVDNVDLDEAARRGILVGHTPDVVTEPTADVAWLLILAAARRAREGHALVASGGWTGVTPHQLLGQPLVGRTLLIVGAGRIGLAVARRSVGWAMDVRYVARSVHPSMEAPPIGGRRVGLAEGLAEADVVSLHVPLTAETGHLIGADELRAMKPTAVLVNTARGPIVDESALVEALRAGTIAGAGLDVFEREPALAEGLAACPNAFFMPHAGTGTVEDRTAMTRIAIANIVGALRGEPMPHAHGAAFEGVAH